MFDISPKCYQCENKKQNYELDCVGQDITNNNDFILPFSFSFPTFKYGFCHTTSIYKYKCSNGHTFNSTYATK